MGDSDVFEINAAYPFAAGFDHILAAICDLHVTLAIDHSHVTGREPSILQYLATLVLEISFDDPGSSHQQVAIGLTIPGKFFTIVIDDLHVDPEDRAPLLFKTSLLLVLG